MAALGTREVHGRAATAPTGDEDGVVPGAGSPLTERPGQPSLPVLPLAASGALLALLALVAVVSLTGAPATERRRDPPRTTPTPTAAAQSPIPQAPWRVTSAPADVSARVTKAQRREVDRQARRISWVLKQVYGALFLRPEARRDVLRDHLVARAASALHRSGAGFPSKAQRVRMVLRRARISVDPTSPRRAVGAVTLRVRGLVEGEVARVSHAATLWLQRSEGRWKVIAFELDQEPVKPR